MITKYKEAPKKKYEKDGDLSWWYNFTYNNLGSNWLIEVLSVLKLPKDFRLANLSANMGKYEKDAYIAIKKLGYNPVFYIGDCSKVDHESSFESFYYLDEAQNAIDVTLPNNEKMNVILDIKGALWHSINDINKLKDDEITHPYELLKQYYGLLSNNDSYFVIDRYRIGFLQFVSNLLKKPFSFAESSSYSYFNYILRKNKIKKLGTKINPVSINKKKKFSKKFKLHYYNKKDLEILLKKLEPLSLDDWKSLSKKAENYVILIKLLPILIPCFVFITMCIIGIIKCII